MEKINNFIKKNLRTISFTNSKKIPDFDSRVIKDQPEFSKISERIEKSLKYSR
jgi:hypothetical protein